MDDTNRQWLLDARPQGAFRPQDLRYAEAPAPRGPLKPGEILVRNVLCLCAPTIRNWMGPQGRFQPSIALGAPVMGPTLARVLDSASPEYPVGRYVHTMSGWQDYALIDTARVKGQLILYPPGVSPVDCMGVFGVNALTAYFGLLRVGASRAGENVLVSAAAGSTGSMVCQYARIQGCRVVGLARGQENKPWLLDTLGVDAVLDPEQDDLAERLRDVFPKGIDLFFDNVGGRALPVAMGHLARRGCVIVCGQVGDYDVAQKAGAALDLTRLVYAQNRVEGFVVTEYFDEAPAAIEVLREWKVAGKLVHREDIRNGFDELPSTFADVFRGGSRGTRLVRIAGEALRPI